MLKTLSLTALLTVFAVNFAEAAVPFGENQNNASAQDDGSYAAIVYSPETGRFGYSFQRHSVLEAQDLASWMANHPTAELIGYSRTRYLALAVGDQPGIYQIEEGDTEEEARSKAMNAIRHLSPNCQVLICVHPEFGRLY